MIIVTRSYDLEQRKARLAMSRASTSMTRRRAFSSINNWKMRSDGGLLSVNESLTLPFLAEAAVAF